MQYIKFNETNYIEIDEMCAEWIYPVKSETINFGVIKINGRNPKTGYQLNERIQMLVYIIEGTGNLSIKNEVTFPFKEKDMFLIDKNESYYFEGNFKASLSCAPAWTKEQHKKVEE